MPRLEALVREQLRPLWHRFGLAVLLVLLVTATTLMLPFAAGQFAAALLSEGIDGSIRIAALGLIALLGAQAAFSYLSSVIIGDSSERFAEEMNAAVFAHVQSLALHDVADARRGDLIALLDSDVHNFSAFISGTLIAILPQLLTLLGTFAVVATLDVRIALLVLMIAPLMFVSTRLISRKIQSLNARVFDIYAARMDFVSDNLDLFRLIKSTASESREVDRYRVLMGAMLELNVRLLGTQQLLSPISQFIGMSGIVVVLAFTAASLSGEGVAVDEFVTLMIFGLLLVRSLGGLAGVYGELQEARASAERVELWLTKVPESTGTVIPTRGAAPEIRFEDVWFAYGGGEPVLRGIDLTIGAGEVVVLTGENGAGKSTLVDLLCGFVRPQRGRVLVDGVDVRDYDTALYRRSIGLVHQDATLFDRTVAENLDFGCEEPLDADHALLDFLATLDGGREARVGADGGWLSGGQRQRVALARVLLRRFPIVVMDEATSMLDREARAVVSERIEGLRRHSTVLLISHDPELEPGATRVVEIRNGEIVQDRVRQGAGARRP